MATQCSDGYFGHMLLFPMVTLEVTKAWPENGTTEVLHRLIDKYGALLKKKYGTVGATSNWKLLAVARFFAVAVERQALAVPRQAEDSSCNETAVVGGFSP